MDSMLINIVFVVLGGMKIKSFNYKKKVITLMEYYVLASLVEDINSGWCWIKGPSVSSRSLVEIKNNKNGKSILCEALSVDDNFEKTYKNRCLSKTNESILDKHDSVLMNAWYRERLGIDKTQIKYDLQVLIVSDWCVGKRIKACATHPQVAVRLSTWLGVVGVFLGAVSLITSQSHKLMTVTVIGFIFGRLNMMRTWFK